MPRERGARLFGCRPCNIVTPVVIFSLATSTPEDVPRGMHFLYSLNRLNVAVSRARTACLLVGSPKLFEPECRIPAQIRLANYPIKRRGRGGFQSEVQICRSCSRLHDGAPCMPRAYRQLGLDERRTISTPRSRLPSSPSGSIGTARRSIARSGATTRRRRCKLCRPAPLGHRQARILLVAGADRRAAQADQAHSDTDCHEIIYPRCRGPCSPPTHIAAPSRPSALAGFPEPWMPPCRSRPMLLAVTTSPSSGTG